MSNKNGEITTLNNSNDVMNLLNQIINEVKTTIPTQTRMPGKIWQLVVINMVEHYIYGVFLVKNFKDNLNEENIEEYNITKEDVNKIRKEFSRLFEKCKFTVDYFEDIINNVSRFLIKENEVLGNKWINYGVYQRFKKELNGVSKNSYKLLIDIEKFIDINSCEKALHKFKKEVEKIPSKKLKMGITKNDDYGIGVSFDLESDGEDKDSA